MVNDPGADYGSLVGRRSRILEGVELHSHLWAAEGCSPRVGHESSPQKALAFAMTHCDEMAFEGEPCFLVEGAACPEGLAQKARKHNLYDAGRCQKPRNPSMMRVASVYPVCV